MARLVLFLVTALGLSASDAVAEIGSAEEAPSVSDAIAGVGSAEEVTRCVKDNLDARSTVQTIVLQSQDRVGAVTESRAKLYWQRDEENLSRVLLRFTAPPDQRGSALLLIQKPKRNDIFTYLPELGRSRRITGHSLSGAVFGTDFTYEQFERMQGASKDVAVERLEDAELDGRPVHVLAHTPSVDDGSQFERIVSYIDPKTCVPLKTEYFERGARLRKVLSADPARVELVGDSQVPREVVMHDLRDQTLTKLVVEEIDLDTKVHRKFFTQRELERGN